MDELQFKRWADTQNASFVLRYYSVVLSQNRQSAIASWRPLERLLQVLPGQTLNQLPTTENGESDMANYFFRTSGGRLLDGWRCFETTILDAHNPHPRLARSSMRPVGKRDSRKRFLASRLLDAGGAFSSCLRTPTTTSWFQFTSSSTQRLRRWLICGAKSCACEKFSHWNLKRNDHQNRDRAGCDKSVRTFNSVRSSSTA